jgi:hypothetical protein
MIRFRKKLIVLLLTTSLNKIDIIGSLSKADDRVDGNMNVRLQGAKILKDQSNHEHTGLYRLFYSFHVTVYFLTDAYCS